MTFIIFSVIDPASVMTLNHPRQHLKWLQIISFYPRISSEYIQLNVLGINSSTTVFSIKIITFNSDDCRRLNPNIKYNLHFCIAFLKLLFYLQVKFLLILILLHLRMTPYSPCSQISVGEMALKLCYNIVLSNRLVGCFLVFTLQWSKFLSGTLFICLCC